MHLFKISVFVQCTEAFVFQSELFHEAYSSSSGLQNAYGLQGESGPKVFQDRDDRAVALVGGSLGRIVLLFLFLFLFLFNALAVGAKQPLDPVTLHRPGRSHAQLFQMLDVDEGHTLDAVLGTVEHLDFGCRSPPYVRPLKSRG